jgi:hypothetical protein
VPVPTVGPFGIGLLALLLAASMAGYRRRRVALVERPRARLY